MTRYPKQESLEENVWVADHYIELAATADKIWPWLAQMGNGRAGWYSYDWIDNLGKSSLNFIDPKLVDIQKGQKISIFLISDFVVNEFVTLQFGSATTFTYYLEPLGERTRLWSRLRVPKAGWVLKSTLGPAHKVMQDKQFLELKKRVEKIR